MTTNSHGSARPAWSGNCGRVTDSPSGRCRWCTSARRRICEIPGCTTVAVMKSRRCAEHQFEHRKAGALVQFGARYRDDIAAQLFVSAYPEGATLEEVGAAFGVTRERIRQLQTKAFAHLKKRLLARARRAHPLAEIENAAATG